MDMDLNKLSVKQLKKILDSEKVTPSKSHWVDLAIQVSYAGLSEKHEFIAKIEELEGSAGESSKI